jgi:hypothetical protein
MPKIEEKQMHGLLESTALSSTYKLHIPKPDKKTLSDIESRIMTQSMLMALDRQAHMDGIEAYIHPGQDMEKRPDIKKLLRGQTNNVAMYDDREFDKYNVRRLTNTLESSIGDALKTNLFSGNIYDRYVYDNPPLWYEEYEYTVTRRQKTDSPAQSLMPKRGKIK